MNILLTPRANVYKPTSFYYSRDTIGCPFSHCLFLSFVNYSNSNLLKIDIYIHKAKTDLKSFPGIILVAVNYFFQLGQS